MWQHVVEQRLRAKLNTSSDELGLGVAGERRNECVTTRDPLIASIETELCATKTVTITTTSSIRRRLTQIRA
jgi:hypothetical protein